MEGGQTTVYLALGHKNLYEKTGTVATKHIFAGSQRIAEVKNGVVTYYHNDHLGSPRSVTNVSGTLISTMATTPFGVPHSTTAPTAYRFTGKELDSTGLYYFAARYYDGYSGRFISQDAWQGTLCTPESQNRYLYVINNPLRYVDPTGRNYLLFAEESAGGGAAVGGGADGTGTNSPGARTKQDDELDVKNSPEPNKGNNSNNPSINSPVKPEVSDPKLKNYVNDIWKHADKPGTVGNGTTIDAIRYESLTGEPIQGKYHWEKGYDILRGLYNRIYSGMLSPGDEAIAWQLVWELTDALSGNMR